MKQRSIRYSMLLPFLAMGAAAAQAAPMSLRFEDLPRLVRDGNQEVQGAYAMSDAAERRTGYWTRSFIPTLELQGGIETFETGIYRMLTQPYGAIEARWNLFRGGRDLLEDRVRQAEVELSSMQARQAYRRDLLDARKEFWTLVHQREQIAILKKALEQNERYLVAASRRSSRGLTTGTDSLDFKIQASQLREEIESLEHATLLTRIKLLALLGFSDEGPVGTVESVEHVHDEVLLAAKSRVDAHPGVAGLHANETVQRSRATQSGRWWLPSVDLYGGYYLYTLRERDYLDQSLRSDIAGGVRVSIALFDGLQSRSESASHARQAEGLALQASQRARAVAATTRVAQEDMKHEHELIHEAEERIDQGETYLRLTVGEYDRGVKNSPDVLSAFQRLLGFRRRYAELKFNYQVAKAELLAALGDEEGRIE
jgi:outer membrane protein